MAISFGTPPSTPSRSPALPQHLAHVTLLVHDYDEAKRYFTERLGFRVLEDTPLSATKRWLLVAPPGGAGPALLLARAATPEQAAVVGRQGGGRVLFFLRTDDFRRDYEAYRARGVAFIEAPREEPYGTVVVFEDLYGNRWDLVQRRDAAHPPAAASRALLQHFLAALAYRTQKALRGAPAHFADFRAGPHLRTPHELLWHMTGVIGYARTMLHGGEFAPPRLPTLADEVARFHATLEALRDDLGDDALRARISDEQFLQGPLADAMTHAGQLAMLRRLAGSPVASEDFIFADVRAENVGAAQPEPAAPDRWWRPDQPPQPPGPVRTPPDGTT